MPETMTPVYLRIVREQRVDPLGGKSPADQELAAATRKWNAAKAALSEVGKEVK